MKKSLPLLHVSVCEVCFKTWGYPSEQISNNAEKKKTNKKKATCVNTLDHMLEGHHLNMLASYLRTLISHHAHSSAAGILPELLKSYASFRNNWIQTKKKPISN